MPELYAADLEDDTAFERLFLSTAYPLANSGVWESAGTYDLARRKVVKQLRGALDNLGTTPESARELLLIHPLAFGAAWKVLDLMLEYAFEASGQMPKSGKRWTIAEKVQLGRKAAGQADPLTNYPPVWKALSSLYAETYETRHSLVHRRVERLPDASLVGVDDQGNSLRPLTLEEQESACYAAQRAVDAVIRGAISDRERSDLAWRLDKLAPVHGAGTVGGRQVSVVLRYEAPVADPNGVFELDGTLMKQQLGPTGTAQWIEVVFESAVGALVAQLDDIPDGIHSVDSRKPPAWAQQI